MKNSLSHFDAKTSREKLLNVHTRNKGAIMKIRYTNAADPKLNNTETHLPNHVAQVLIATGAAVEVKLPRRGAPGWAEARVAESKELSHGPSIGDTVVEFHKDQQWSIAPASISGRLTIFLKHGYECYRFVGENAAAQARAAGCPTAVLKAYADALATKDVSAQQVAEAKVEQQKREAEEKTARWAHLSAG